jgi:hypothetical protein
VISFDEGKIVRHFGFGFIQYATRFAVAPLFGPSCISLFNSFSQLVHLFHLCKFAECCTISFWFKRVVHQSLLTLSWGDCDTEVRKVGITVDHDFGGLLTNY